MKQKRVAKKNVGKAEPKGQSAVTLGICFVLFAVTWVVFGRTLSYPFINFDDYAYVYGNPEVRKGLSLHGIAWAFTHVHGGNWHPLTSISHLLDCQLYGLNAGSHHFTNVLLHSIAVILLFLLLQQMTGARWRSAFVTALFAIHPLRVESVAWIAERKDVLSGVFFMLTLMAYVRYVRRPSSARYWPVLFLFALGLMSKPMLVTLPFVLLLLDYWPLGRVRSTSSAAKSKTRHADVRNVRSIGQLLIEKIPLLILSAASCVAALLAQAKAQAIVSVQELPLTARISNAFVSCIVYLGQLFWPRSLGLFYPYAANNLLVGEGVLAIAALLVISTIFVVLRKTHPYLITGWLWYLGMLVPVIGVIQVGMQAHADRYTYLPQIGLSFALVWGINDLSSSWRHRRTILGVIGGLAIVVLTGCAWIQTSYWSDSEKLWGHTLAVTPNTSLAEASLGDALLKEGRAREAIPYYEKALVLQPDDAEARNNLAYSLRQSGRLDEAIAQFRKVVELRSRHADPKKADAYSNLGRALVEKNQLDEAIDQYRHAVDLQPDTWNFHNSLGNALLARGLTKEAVVQYEKALAINPRSVAICGNLAWILATSSDPALRDGSKALELARLANERSGGRDPLVLNALAVAYAETGQFPQALSTAQQALDLVASQGSTDLTKLLRHEIDLYRAGSPYHQAAP